ncbi:12784_t:CDS:2 [Dentiscutata erythropus]|uniref:U3 small nucleolar RNA-associated protein 18 homolog n=1 Tax=Dentiscutata erythropus TaxID=1348616 RepID=A0A9N8W227_9GLOM|nr:12784_t:CDS:2 [Dentiscutata erythropus]
MSQLLDKVLMNTEEPSYDILGEIDDNFGGSDTEIPMPSIDTTPITPSDVKRYIEEALEISKNKGEDSDDAQNQIVEDTGAWQDSDDEKVCVSLQSKSMLKKLRKNEDEDVISGDKYEKRLRQQFEKLYPTPNWATVPSKRKRQKMLDSSDSSDDEPPEELEIRNEPDKRDKHIESDTHNEFDSLKIHTKLLSKKKLEVTKMKHVNQQAYSQSVIQSIAFHPNAQVAMTAGLDKTIRLFQVDGKINPKVQSVVLKDLPIYRAAFNPNGTEIIAAGRKKYFYIFNIEAGSIDKSNGIYGFQDKSLENFSISPCGQYIVFAGSSGYLVLVSNRTKQWIANMKMNGTVTSVDWSNDGRYLYSVGNDAEVYQWDVNTRRCVHRFRDDGGFKPTKISVSKNGHYFAIGSNSGIVNVYDETCLILPNPKPLKSIMNLTTNVHDMKFNHDSQILGISSHSKKNQLKLVHLPSLNVFPNWPNNLTPLNYVQCFDFSPASGYIAIGNDKGKALLYRLRHYPVA